ncbi:MAG: cupin domain-containing protein [Chloroflexota bacterium]|nr:cupin domain-containing protein [Chloroflexota bacterium]
MSGDWSSGPGDHYREHRHDYDKVLMAKSGSITFRLPERDGAVELRAGDQLDLPAGTLHEADVGPSGVTCSETHLTRGTLTEVRLHVAGTGASETAVRRGA